MTDGTNGIRESLGRIEGKLDGIQDRVDRVESGMDLIREQCQEFGKALAIQVNEGSRRERRISTLERGLRVVENTGQTFIVRAQATWKVIVIAITASAGLVATVEVLLRLWRK